ncbi:MAG: response regulator [Actinobacteria bacterium]|nr:response regulator [Actinomycetota bacterium]MCL5887552.1 response regulator [Actinomycetota bacterium]
MSRRTILIVEDTELIRKIYADKLSQEGYQVLAVGNGLDALNTLKSNEVHLILLDLIMPTMSGLEVLEAIKADPRFVAIPVIVLTNLGHEADIEAGMELGADDYLVKNQAKPSDVVDKIHRLLDEKTSEAREDTYRLFVKDREGDADRFISDMSLRRRLWCPACEVELQLELIPKPQLPGWFDATIVCPTCGKGQQ